MVQQPVVGFTALVPGAEDIYRIVKQFEHLVAPLDAPGIVLKLGAAQIGPGQIGGLQEVLNGPAVLDLKFLFHLLDGQFHAPYHIPVLFQQPPGVVICLYMVLYQS